ncbi:MAG: phenylalanine--tRNA ligase subunit beta, partial [Oscillospiraceae bacterium]
MEVQNKELCKRYVARAITDVKVEPSPRWLRERLRAMGVRPINNIVDITNFVMLEYGQPMHAFDVKTVAGGKIIARNAFEGEKIVTLDGVERTLSADMLVIADETAPSAIAGVMGSGRSGIREDTVTVIFESANFKGSNVRITAQKLGMRTEASGRFEKGLDTEICPMAADRACELVELLSAGKVMGGVIDVNNSQYAPKRIELQPQWINKFLGIFVPTDKMHEILKKLEFQIDGDYVIPPSFRGDIEHKADVAEEIARYYGYNKIPSTSIKGTVYGKVTRRQHLESLAVNTMLAQGLNEICTYTFFAPKAYDKIRLPEDSPLRNSVKILNPLGEDTSVMRTTPLPSMLAALATNYFDRNADSAFFEIAKEFVPKASVDELPFENTSLMLGMYGDKWDYYRLKGVVEAFLKAFGIDDYDVE